jgi:hypothetical protein
MANVTDACNHTQFLPGSHDMNLGSVQLSDIPALGIAAGEAQATTSSFGAHNLNIARRQMILELRLQF